LDDDVCLEEGYRRLRILTGVKSSDIIIKRGVQVEPGCGTFNFTGIKRDASVAVLHAVVSGKCVLLLIGGTHVAGQSRDR
jgi:hypothetical protein